MYLNKELFCHNNYSLRAKISDGFPVNRKEHFRCCEATTITETRVKLNKVSLLWSQTVKGWQDHLNVNDLAYWYLFLYSSDSGLYRAAATLAAQNQPQRFRAIASQSHSHGRYQHLHSDLQQTACLLTWLPSLFMHRFLLLNLEQINHINVFKIFPRTKHQSRRRRAEFLTVQMKWRRLSLHMWLCSFKRAHFIITLNFFWCDEVYCIALNTPLINYDWVLAVELYVANALS